MTATMPQKRTALAAIVAAVLQAHDARFVVEDRIRAATLDGRDRADRLDLMGDPVRYADVTYAGEASETPNLHGRPLQVGHLFRVSVWMLYADAPTYAASSQALWDAVLENGPDADEPGLLTHFRTVPSLVASNGVVCEVTPPREVDVPAIADLSFRSGAPEYAHQAQFTLTVR